MHRFVRPADPGAEGGADALMAKADAQDRQPSGQRGNGGARDAGLLGLEQGDLVLLLECVSYDASGQAIEYVKSFNRGDAGGYTYTY